MLKSDLKTEGDGSGNRIIKSIHGKKARITAGGSCIASSCVFKTIAKRIFIAWRAGDIRMEAGVLGLGE